MNLAGTKTALVALLVVLAFSGCRKKKEPTITPQAQAPTVGAPQKPGSTTSRTEPSGTQPATTTPSSTAPAASAPATTTTTTKPKTKRQPKPPKQQPSAATTNGGAQNAGAKPATEAPATTASTATPAPGTPPLPPKVVVQDGGEPPAGQISAAGDNHEGSRQSIEQLLQSTDSNLRSISRQLSDAERAMVEQIRNYMAQARVASTDGDLTRANNLALKAHLLSDELVKR
jgi:outer membrane biosynthesis protein TonB